MLHVRGMRCTAAGKGEKRKENETFGKKLPTKKKPGGLTLHSVRHSHPSTHPRHRTLPQSLGSPLRLVYTGRLHVRVCDVWLNLFYLVHI